MRSAIQRVDIVCKGQKRLVIARCVLKGDFRHCAVFLAAHIYYILMRGFFIFIDILYKLAYAALIAHFFTFGRVFTHVCNFDGQTRIQKRLFANALQKHVIIIFQRFKNFVVS